MPAERACLESYHEIRERFRGGVLVQLNLEQRELDLLRNLLERALGDLRMEVGKTENYQMRTELKEDEAVLKGIIERLSVTARG